jgi:phage-related protein (TIGR01555 family)
LFRRLDLFTSLRDNRGTFVVNKADEDFDNVSAPLTGLDQLQAQAQEHISSISGMPLIIYLGIQPAGLNASSEGELEAWYTYINACQESFFRPHLTRVINFVQLSEFGEVDPDIIYDFESLQPLNRKEAAETSKTEAEADQTRIDSGVISPAEARQRVAADPDSGYSSIDVDDVPDLLEEEEQGLEPRGARSSDGGEREAA